MPDPDAWRVRDAVMSGLSRGHLRSSAWSRQFWGVRSRTPILPERAFSPRLGRDAFFYGVSAARLHRLPLPTRLGALPVHVGVPVGVRRPSARDVAPHHIRIAAADLTRIDGIPVTTIERTWCDLAATGLSLGELVAVGDAILHVRGPRSSEGSLRSAAARYEGRRGARTMAAAFPLLDGRADSAPESELRVALVGSGAPIPEVNHPIRLRGVLVHVDMAWPESLVAVEYEGDHHRTDRGQWHYDIRRYAALADAGWTIIRATAADYRDPSDLIARVARVARAARAARTSPTSRADR